MMHKVTNKVIFSSLKPVLAGLLTSALLAALMMFQSCDKEDPEPVNEEEVITTLEVTLTPAGGGVPVTLKFYDADGELGSIAPLLTVSGPLKAMSTYTGSIRLLNETVTPTDDITLEVEEESDDHLFCFDVSGNLAVQYEDTDSKGLPVGLTTSWITGGASPASVTVSLRHQPGTKTGDCPGTGETDAEVTFNLTIE